jgi:hypothetical protein
MVRWSRGFWRSSGAWQAICEFMITPVVVVVVNAPRGWQAEERTVLRNNRNDQDAAVGPIIRQDPCTACAGHRNVVSGVSLEGGRVRSSYSNRIP